MSTKNLRSETLEEIDRRGRERWPGVELSRKDLAAALGAEPPEGIHAEDFYLATACARGSRAAIEAFEQHFLSAGALTAGLRRIEPSAAFLDEVRQAVREKLFVPPPGKIAEYAGKGSLSAWTKVVAMRTALDLRPRRVEQELSADGILAGEREPELRLLQQKYGKQFEEAVAASFAFLSDDQANLLKLQVVDGLQTAQLAALFHVDRSTIKRRLADCREIMLTRTREVLAEKLGLSPDSFASVARVLVSQMHLSVARILKNRS